MTEKRFQKRYVKKDNKVFDTWKNMPISRELDKYSLSHIISHLNGLGEIIDTHIEQGRYCFRQYNELKEENKQLKKEYREMEIKIGKLKGEIGELFCENEQLKSEINMLKTTIGRNEGYIDRLTHTGEWR